MSQIDPLRPRLRSPRDSRSSRAGPIGTTTPGVPGVPVDMSALVDEALFAAVAEQLEENRRHARERQRGVRQQGLPQGHHGSISVKDAQRGQSAGPR
jgi:hypothetical protein